MQWIIFLVLFAGAAAALLSELAFPGRFLPGSAFSFAAGMLLIGTVLAAGLAARYRSKFGAAARDLIIWVAIVVAIVAGYWLVANH